MNLDLNKKSHKVIVFLMIAVPSLIIGFALTYFTQQQPAEAEKPKTEKVELKESAAADPSPAPEEKQETELIIKISEEDKAASKLVAEKFAQAYANYNSEEANRFVQNAKPYMTEGFYSEWEKEAPRRPLALVTSKVLKTETFPIEAGDQYTIAWNVVLTQEQTNPLGDVLQVEEWFWILMVKENGEWKVKDVDINNG